MTARVENPDVANHGRSIRATFEIRNVSGEPLRLAEGFAVGYHIFDPTSDALVVDGPRVAPGADIAPGESRRFDLRFDLPAEPGRYRVFVSLMQENVCWFYERGSQFLLIDAAVETGRATIHRFRVATQKLVRRERFLRSLK